MSQSPALDPLFLPFQQALAGRYSIDRELGRGGMGIVYLAREVHLDRMVAIKLLPPERAADPTLRDRFLREARLAAKLSHPNIIPIHSVEEIGGFVYFVMAFVDGETLAQRVRGRGPLPPTEGARVLREVAWALSYAHGQGLVHRDVKPDNILLENATHRVLVADFGIAAAFGDQSAEGVTGTPEFMSPEQVLGNPLDARSDLYSLGATAFYAFTGRFPFEGTSATEVLAKQVTAPAPPLSSLGVVLPRKLASLVDRCLAKEPAHRPESAQVLAEHLSVALEKRRELPAALRAFVKRNGRLNGGGTLIVGFFLLPASMALASLFGIAAGWTTFALGGIVAPGAYLVSAARRLLKLGFGHGDIGPAFQAEIEQSREELLSSAWGGPTRIERVTRVAAIVSGGIAISSIAAMMIRAFAPIPHAMYRDMGRFLGTVLPFSLTAAVMLTLASLTFMQRHRDIDGEFWAKVWNSDLGRWSFAVAKKLLGKRAPIAAVTHRATELSLGMAADQLYETLPRETRQALGDLPAVVRRLQEDAQALRKRYDDLQDALSSAGDASMSAEYSDVRAFRDRIQEQLSGTVVALETIRLNLLRLHAGTATVESFTTHLGMAAEVSDQVGRLIAAHAEVERALKFPRAAVPTPA